MPKSFDITLERQAIYQDFHGQPGPCPRCGGPLAQRTQMYLVDTRQGKRLADSFMLGGDFGWFCAACPTVVINTRECGAMLSHGKPGWKIGSEFAVLGLVNLDAVPQDKRHLLLGEDDNPIPLVAFKDVVEAEPPTAGPTPSLWPRQPRLAAPPLLTEPPPGPLPGRNAPCWCGSGEKYKACHYERDQERATTAIPAGKKKRRHSGSGQASGGE